MSDPDANRIQHALVTGASRGLGAAMAIALAKAGCDLTINYRAGRDAAEETAKSVRQAGRRAIVVQADVSDPASVTDLAQQAREALGPVSVLVNNAGIGHRRNVFENTVDDFDRTLTVNVRSAFLVTQAVIPDMRELGFGRLIFLSSIAAFTGGMISTPYATSKAALVGHDAPLRRVATR